MGGAGDVKGVFVFFLVLVVYLGVNSETRFLGMDFRLRKVMERFCLMRGVGVSMSTVRARWSEMVEPRSVLMRLLMVSPVVQIRSRV